MSREKINQALEHLYAGDSSPAELLLRQVGNGALQPPPGLAPLDEAAYWEGAGGLALAREKGDDAVAAFRRMIALEQRGGADVNAHATSYAKLGQALALTDRLDEAIEAFNTAVAKKEECGAPESSRLSVVFRFADCLFRGSRFNEAAEQFAKAAALASGADENTQATLLLYQAEAIKHAIAPMQARLRVQTGMSGASPAPQIALLEKQLEGKFQQAVDLYRKAGGLADRAGMPPEFKLQIQRGMAEAYHDAGRYVKGVLQRKKLIQMAEAQKAPPLEVAYMLHGLAESHKEMGQLPEAVETYRRSIALKERHQADKVSLGKSWYALGEVYAGQKKHDAAVEALSRARELEQTSGATDENHPLRLRKAWHTLGMVLQAAGKQTEAKAAMDKAESLGRS